MSMNSDSTIWHHPHVGMPVTRKTESQLDQELEALWKIGEDQPAITTTDVTAIPADPKLSVRSGNDERPNYDFPSLSGCPTFDALSTPELRDQLARMTMEAARQDGGYLDVRQAFCAIHLELNTRRVNTLAPRFRPGLRPRGRFAGAIYPEADRLLSNDLQVIDLNWLHEEEARTNIRNARWKPLGMRGVLFDFALASAFAATAGAPAAKAAEILRLRTADQCQLSMLQDRSMAERWRIIQRGRAHPGGYQVGVDDVRMLFDEQANGNPLIEAQIDDWVTVWACWRLLGEKTGKPLAKLFALATGKAVPDASSLGQRLARARKYLP